MQDHRREVPRIGLYVHVPFCRSKCAYCDFASLAGHAELYEPYGRAVVEELRTRPGLHHVDRAGTDGERLQADSIYIGGGTPSVLPLSILSDILLTARQEYTPPPGAEITVEVNPGTVGRDELAALRSWGVNRLSVGVQSFDDAELRLLGRIHDRERALRALADAREAGFENLSLDLIYGLPRQRMATWEASLGLALGARPSHISIYALSVEEGTPLARLIECGSLPPPDDDLAAEMYLLADARLVAAGYRQYEISNWSLPGSESRHNLNTWRNGPYLGFGPAAHSHMGRRRWWNVRDPAVYIGRMTAGASPVEGVEEIDPATDVAERVILGLRLVQEGVPEGLFRERYGSELAELVRLGLLESTEGRVRLTPSARLVSNQVFVRLLPG